MKNISLIINVLLLIAVGLLYLFQFQKEEIKEQAEPINESVIGDMKIAFVNTDTLLKYYSLSDVLMKQLEVKRDKFQAEYLNREKGLQAEIDDYQQNAGNLTMGQARNIEENLMKKQQNLQQYSQTLAQDMAREQNRVNTQLYDSVANFLGKYGTEQDIKIVLTYTKGNPNVLYAANALDITQILIDGLNTRQESQKNPGK
ncbi:MAG TPA: OmpH family outer membrane protein [Cyclobacteriaceae bacterium]|jgi:outer membrane protein